MAISTTHEVEFDVPQRRVDKGSPREANIIPHLISKRVSIRTKERN
jgi:hypothetical protein